MWSDANLKVGSANAHTVLCSVAILKVGSLELQEQAAKSTWYLVVKLSRKRGPKCWGQLYPSWNVHAEDSPNRTPIPRIGSRINTDVGLHRLGGDKWTGLPARKFDVDRRFVLSLSELRFPN